MKYDNKNKMKIRFLGMEVECSDEPSGKAVIIIALVLMFFAVVAVLLPKLIFAKAVANGVSRIKWLSG